jgi:DNA-directed RNA polymerase II subunit RPB1
MTKINELLHLHEDEISEEDIKILKKVINSGVYYDEIVAIEEVKPSHKYVYDLTVEDTKNFVLHNGLAVRDSFHHSGIATLSSSLQGVPRMQELLSVSKKPKTPQMIIYLTPEYMSSKDMANKIGSHIKHTTLGDIRGRINVYYDPKPNEKGGIMEKDNVKHVFFHHKGSRTSCQSDYAGLPWLFRIELDREKMLEKEVNLLEIKSKFCSWWEKRFTEPKSMKKEEKKVINKITQIAVLSNTDNDKEPILHIRFNVKDVDKEKDRFDLATIDSFIDQIIDKFKLKGINGISDIPSIPEERVLIYNQETGNIDKSQQYVIYTAGVNLTDIRYLTGVDLTRTISNHVIEMYNTFGIEIARAILLREISNAYERAGGEVNYQHITMIVDQMTSTGSINSVDRHGMNKSDNDPLSRASFEKTVEQMLIAAVYGETDHMKGVSSRIMAGCVIKGGTGYCDLELDTDMIEKSEYMESMDYAKKFTDLNKGTLASDILKKKSKDIFVPA